MLLEEIWGIRCGCIVRLCESCLVLITHNPINQIVSPSAPDSDVSRISDISIQAYLRNVSPGQKNVPTINEDGSEPSNADMGNSDLCLGGVRFTPNLESVVCLLQTLSRE
jgi:hypothetical protein